MPDQDVFHFPETTSLGSQHFREHSQGTYSQAPKSQLSNHKPSFLLKVPPPQIHTQLSTDYLYAHTQNAIKRAVKN